VNASELALILMPLIDHYSPDPESESKIGHKISIDFPNQVFSTKVEPYLSDLITAILVDELDQNSELITENVTLSILTDDEILEVADAMSNSWDEFAEEIKSINRFHLEKVVDLEVLKRIFKSEAMGKPLPKGRIFYRTRISSSNGHKIDRMGNPPPSLATPGRANPIGISYLYVSDQIVTTLYETRAILNDYVTVGEFRVLEKLNILNLNNVEEYFDPISAAENESLNDFITFLPFISKLKEELAKPNRRNDSPIDYLPTQYLAEYIKSLGFDGIEYRSSLYPSGFNYAIFDSSKLQCISVNVHEITGIDYNHSLYEEE